MGMFIIFSLSILAAFWSGFYVGYLKKEGKPPEIPLPDIKEIINSVKPEKRLSKEEQRELEKANSFYN